MLWIKHSFWSAVWTVMIIKPEHRNLAPARSLSQAPILSLRRNRFHPKTSCSQKSRSQWWAFFSFIGYDAISKKKKSTYTIGLSLLMYLDIQCTKLFFSKKPGCLLFWPRFGLKLQRDGKAPACSCHRLALLRLCHRVPAPAHQGSGCSAQQRHKGAGAFGGLWRAAPSAWGAHTLVSKRKRTPYQRRSLLSQTQSFLALEMPSIPCLSAHHDRTILAMPRSMEAQGHSQFLDV